MRGWAIFIVVWVHSTWLMLGASHCWLYSFAVVYPMPVFFVVSGYLRGRKKSDTFRVPWRRWLKLLSLLAAGSCGYAWMAGVPLSLMFGQMYYYWFFAALLLCEIIVEMLLSVVRHSGWFAGSVGAVVVWLMFLFATSLWGHDRLGLPLADMEQYWLFYWLGVLMSVSRRLTDMTSSFPVALCGAVLLAASLITWQDAGTLYGLLGGSGGLSLTWSLTRRLSGKLGMVAWLGRQSLAVFLLSYPVLALLAPWGALVPREWVETPWQWLTAFVVAVPVTAAMAGFSALCGLVWKTIAKRQSI